MIFILFVIPIEYFYILYYFSLFVSLLFPRLDCWPPPPMKHNKPPSRDGVVRSSRTRRSSSRSGSSELRIFSPDVFKSRIQPYQAFRSFPPEEYADHTTTFFAHTVPTRVVTKPLPPSQRPPPHTTNTTSSSAASSSTDMAFPSPRPAFAVCGCEKELDYMGPNLHLPGLLPPGRRGCPECHPDDGDDGVERGDSGDRGGEGLTSKGSSSYSRSSSKASSARRPHGPRGSMSLPRTEERLPPITKALESMGRNTAEFRAAVEKKIPPFPYTQKMSEETKEQVRMYLRVCNAAHLFNYLSKDLLRDRPDQPVDYIIDWLKKRRALYGAPRKDKLTQVNAV